MKNLIRTFCVLSILLFGVQAQAAKKYDLTVDVSFNGEAAAGSVVSVKEGEQKTVVKGGTGKPYVDLVSIEDSKTMDNAISMKFIVGMMEKDGIKTILSSPQIISIKNETAEITVAEKNETSEMESLSMRVKASEKIEE